MNKQLLLCNDDSITSPFLPIFAKKLAEIFDVKIVVPASEQSWIGRAYSRHKKLEVKQVDYYGLDCSTISGTPSDCVNIALGHLCTKKPDIVVSGLNIGQNIAMPLLWSSGTFSAAVEAAGWGYKAFAFSMRLEKQYYEYCRIHHRTVPEDLAKNLIDVSEHSADFINSAAQNFDWKKGDVVNVNYPIKYNKEVEFKETIPANVDLKSLYYKNEDGDFEFAYNISEAEKSDFLTDLEALNKNLATYSVINYRI